MAGGDAQAVPVRPSPRIRTFMGTFRLHCRRSISVSLVNTSVTGLGVYLSLYDAAILYKISSSSDNIGTVVVKECSSNILVLQEVVVVVDQRWIEDTRPTEAIQKNERHWVEELLK